MKRFYIPWVILILAGIITTGSYIYKNSYISRKQQKEVMEDAGIKKSNGIKLIYKKPETKAREKAGNKAVPMPDKAIDLSGMQKKNPDVCGFIYMPDTPVMYPVMRSPDDAYLYKDYHESRSYHGSIFTRSDISSDPLVLFGHNMRDGTMFASIKKFRDSSYSRKHKYVYIYTDNGWRAYKFMDFKVISPDYDRFSRNRLYLITCQGKNDRFLTEWEPV